MKPNRSSGWVVVGIVVCVALACAQILAANTLRSNDADGSREPAKRGSNTSSAIQERRPKSPEAQAAYDVGYNFYQQATLNDKPEDWDAAIEAFTKTYRLEPTWTPVFYLLAAANLGTKKMFLTAVAWGWAYLYADPKGDFAKGAREVKENCIRKAEENRIKIFATARSLVEKVPRKVPMFPDTLSLRDMLKPYYTSPLATRRDEDGRNPSGAAGYQSDFHEGILDDIRYLQAKAGDFDAVIEDVKKNLTKYFKEPEDFDPQRYVRRKRTKCESYCWGAFFNTCLEVNDWQGAEMALTWDFGSLDIPGKSPVELRRWELEHANDCNDKEDFYFEKWLHFHLAFPNYWEQVKTKPDIVKAWARLALQFQQDEREFRMEENLKQLTNESAKGRGNPVELPVEVASLAVPYGKALRRIRGLERIGERVLLVTAIDAIDYVEGYYWAMDLAKTKAAFRDNPMLFRLRDLKDSTVLHAAAMGCQTDLTTRLGEDFYDSDPLKNANDWGSGSSPEESLERVPLVKEFVGFLLANGADVNAKMITGQTPLHLAAAGYTGEPQAVEIAGLLLAKGAEVNIRTTDQYMTPLHFAACTGMPRVVKLLLNHGADVQAVNLRRRTPLHLAALWGRMDVAKALVSAEANVFAIDVDGSTAADIASAKGFTDLAAFLRSR
jgi:hypothetical protein